MNKWNEVKLHQTYRAHTQQVIQIKKEEKKRGCDETDFKLFCNYIFPEFNGYLLMRSTWWTWNVAQRIVILLLLFCVFLFLFFSFTLLHFLFHFQCSFHQPNKMVFSVLLWNWLSLSFEYVYKLNAVQKNKNEEMIEKRKEKKNKTIS